MTTFFISGPITGHADYREEFRQAEDLCRLLGYNYITPRPLEQLVSDPECSKKEILENALKRITEQKSEKEKEIRRLQDMIAGLRQ